MNKKQIFIGKVSQRKRIQEVSSDKDETRYIAKILCNGSTNFKHGVGTITIQFGDDFNLLEGEEVKITLDQRQKTLLECLE